MELSEGYIRVLFDELDRAFQAQDRVAYIERLHKLEQALYLKARKYAVNDLLAAVVEQSGRIDRQIDAFVHPKPKTSDKEIMKAFQDAIKKENKND